MVTVKAVKGWESGLQALHQRIGWRFKRAEPRQRAYRYLQGILSNVVRKNGWQLAEQVGEQRPYGMQRLLRTAVWDEDGVRDDLQAYVIEHLGHANGVLVLDDTGFLKKGQHSAGVKRQYSGAAGGIENCQVGVFLAYTSEHGHALIDRALYLPKDWIADAARRREAKIPEHLTFATKPQLARTLLERAFAAQIPHQWITGDSIYGDDWTLRQWLETQKRWYVLGVTRDHLLYDDGARRRFDEIAASLPVDAWQRLSCGMGTKGERLYEWALVTWQNWQQPADEMHAFLVRRNPTDPTDEAYFLVYAPAGTSLQTLVQVAGQRWAVEECFELAKGEVGLDQYEVRQYRAWYRYMTLAMLALAFLVVVRSIIQHRQSEKKWRWNRRRLSSYPSLKFAVYCTVCCGQLTLPFNASWPGRVGVVSISSRLNTPISVVSCAF
jgi:SRSO17 transposase